MKIFTPLLALLLFPGQALAQQRDTVEVGILVDRITPELRPLLDRMQQEIRNVVRADAVIRFSEQNLSIDFSLDRAAEAWEAMVDGEPDIILAFGPVSSEAAEGRSEYPKPTIVFGVLNRDLAAEFEERTTSGIHNFTYVISTRSYERDLATFKDLYDFRNLGVVVPAEMLNALPIVDALDQAATSLGVNYELIPYDSPSSLRPYLDRVDAVYLAEGFGIPVDEVREIADTLIAIGTPSFSGARREDVEMGFMASNRGREGFERMFRRLALNVEAVVNGEDLSTRPVLVEVSQTLTINLQTANGLGVPPRFSMLATTDFVGGYENPRAAQTYALEDLVREALEANLTIASGRSDVRLADQATRTAWSSYLPSVSTDVTGSAIDPDLARLSAGQNPQYSAQGRLSLTQVLFSPGANAAISIQRSLAHARSEEYEASELDLILDAGSAYFNALIAKAYLRIQLQNLEATKRNLRIAEQRFEGGQSGRGDVLRLESEAAQDMQSLVEAYKGFEQSLHSINQLLNRPIGREIDVREVTLQEGFAGELGHEEIRQMLDDPRLRSSFEKFLVAEALGNSPELRAFDYSLAATTRNVKLNGLERFLPTVAGGLDFTRNINRWGTGLPDPALVIDNYYTIGVSASIPLFDSNLRNIDRQSAKIREEQLNLDRAYTAGLIERNVRDVVLEVTNQIAKMELSAVSEDAAAESLELARVAFANGAINIVELLDAQTNYVRSQLARASATYTFLATTLVVQRLTGHYFILRSEEENREFRRRFEAFRATQIGGGQ